MSAYTLVKLLHVLAAVLGLGLIGAIALLARAEATRPRELLTLARVTTASLVIMLTTGIALNLLSGGLFHHRLWFRLAGASLIVTGAIVGLLRRQLRRWDAGELDMHRARRNVIRSSWAASALVAWITLLMELRPFQ